MESFLKKNMGIVAFYIILVGGLLLINAKFSPKAIDNNTIIAINNIKKINFFINFIHYLPSFLWQYYILKYIILQ